MTSLRRKPFFSSPLLSLPHLERHTSYRPPRKPHSAPGPGPAPCTPPRFHYISTCTQFARTDSCLLLWGRRSENIEPAHCAERQHWRHNSDSSERKAGKKKEKEKCFDVQKSLPPFSIFHPTCRSGKKGAAPDSLSSPHPVRTREVRGVARYLHEWCER